MQIANCKLKIANCPPAARVGGSDRSLPPAPCSLPRRSGVTLVELLITIMIIAILAGMILGVASVAGETAREAHTRHMVARLHTLLVQHLDTYKTRRVKLNPLIEAIITNNSSLTAAQKGMRRAQYRLNALRELMLMEIPDRWSDIAFTTSEKVPSSGTPTIRFPIYLDPTGTNNGRTELGNTYLRRYIKAAQTAPDLESLRDNQSAECLYLVITIACGDGEARTLFHESNIGDTDGDGAPEFLDGWGHPISFLRWTPGFDSEIQLNANLLSGNPPLKTGDNPTWESAASRDHDPYDLFRADPAAFRLVPLIYSGGRDEQYSLWTVRDFVRWQGRQDLVSLPSPIWSLSPYAKSIDDDSNTSEYMGTALDGTATDNIHNHLLGQR